MFMMFDINFKGYTVIYRMCSNTRWIILILMPIFPVTPRVGAQQHLLEGRSDLSRLVMRHIAEHDAQFLREVRRHDCPRGNPHWQVNYYHPRLYHHHIWHKVTITIPDYTIIILKPRIY